MSPRSPVDRMKAAVIAVMLTRGPRLHLGTSVQGPQACLEWFRSAGIHPCVYLALREDEDKTPGLFHDAISELFSEGILVLEFDSLWLTSEWFAPLAAGQQDDTDRQGRGPGPEPSAG